MFFYTKFSFFSGFYYLQRSIHLGDTGTMTWYLHTHCLKTDGRPGRRERQREKGKLGAQPSREITVFIYIKVPCSSCIPLYMMCSEGRFFHIFGLSFTPKSTIFQLCLDCSSCVEPVLSCVLLKDTTQCCRWGSKPQPFDIESSTLYHWAPIRKLVYLLNISNDAFWWENKKLQKCMV